VVGNRTFYVAVSYAPKDGIAVLVLGLGPCTAGMPALCGQFFPALAPAPLVLPALALVGPSSCTGSAVLPIPLAGSPALCGLQVCVQAIVGCTQGGFGLTRALTLRVLGA
jgi:hypothetical protein